MKKIILFFLLTTGTGTVLHAQFDLPDPVDNVFNNPKSGRGNASFTFIVSQHVRVLLDLHYISQVENLPNLDSMLRVAITTLAPLQDSLKADGMVRRLDIVMNNEVPKIRLLSHPELSNTFTVKDNELMQLKVNQDTLRLIGFANSNVKNQFTMNGVSEKRPIGGPFAVTVILDNFADLEKLDANQFDKCIAVLKQNAERHIRSDRYLANSVSYRATFYMPAGNILSGKRIDFAFRDEQKIQPSGNFTITYARGGAALGIQTAVDFNLTKNNFFRSKLRVYLETQGFFSRDQITNKLNYNASSFVGVQYLRIPTAPSDKFVICGNLNLAYQTNRNSLWYDPNTFRFGLPVISNGTFTIEPHIVFSGWFKNTTLGVRLLIKFL